MEKYSSRLEQEINQGKRERPILPENYDHFYDRHKSWDELRNERYNC